MKKLLETKNWWFWILLAISFKSILLIYYVNHIDPRLRDAAYTGAWGAFGGDTYTYLNPIENLLSHGTYAPNDRLPGYGMIYFFLRLFTNTVHALNALILLQVVVSGISVYVLAITSSKIFNHKYAFNYSFFVYLFSELAFSWDYLILTESFTLSALIFFTFCFTTYLTGKGNLIFMVLAGIFLTWAVFLKPVYVLIFAIASAVIFIWFLREKKKTILLGFIAFVSPFVIVDGAWIITNYFKEQRIIPLTPHMYLDCLNNTYDVSLIRFMQSWGGDIAWDAGTDSRWFYPTLNNATCAPCAQELEKNARVKLPGYIYTSLFNEDSLISIRSKIATWDSLHSAHADTQTLKTLKAGLEITLNSYTESVKTEKPFLFYIKSRFVNLKRFVMLRTLTTPLIFHPYNKLKLSIFALSQALYYFTLLSGLFVSFLTIVVSIKQSRIEYALLMVSLILLYGFFIFPLLKLSEHRYLAPEYPFIVICSTAFFIKLRDKFL